jgi:hypothetical protein
MTNSPQLFFLHHLINKAFNFAKFIQKQLVKTFSFDTSAETEQRT